MKKVTSLRLPDAVHRIIDRSPLSDNRTSAVERMISDGCKWQMLTHTKPLSPRYLMRLSPEAVFELFERWESAVCQEIGVPAPLSQRFVFVESPEKGFYQVIEKNELRHDLEITDEI
jgi:hypothetical protein